MARLPFTRIGIAGAGVIGSGNLAGLGVRLAELGVTAESGGRIVLYDKFDAAIIAAMGKARDSIDFRITKRRLKPEIRDVFGDMVRQTTTLADLAECDLVLESLPEDRDLKRQFYSALRTHTKAPALSTTSAIPPAHIGADGLAHPFTPCDRRWFIEFAGPAAARLWFQRMGWTCYDVKPEIPGFAIDPLLSALVVEAVCMVEEGLGTVAEVNDWFDQLFGGSGPFNVMDITKGNPLVVSVLTSMYQHLEAWENAWFASPKKLIDQGTTLWLDPKRPAAALPSPDVLMEIEDRVLATFAWAQERVDREGILRGGLGAWNDLTRRALGFKAGVGDILNTHEPGRIQRAARRHSAEGMHFQPSPPDHQGSDPCSSVDPRRAVLTPFRHDVSVREEGGVAIITITRPEQMNAIRRRTLLELAEVVAGLSPNLAGAVFTGEGGILAGADVELFAKMKAEQLLGYILLGQSVFASIQGLPIPTIAAYDGFALGGGAELGAACDARIMTPWSMFGQPEVTLGLIPGFGGTVRTFDWVSAEKGRFLLETGKKILAPLALEIGWATVLTDDDVVAEACRMLREQRVPKTSLAPDVLTSEVDDSEAPVAAERPELGLSRAILGILSRHLEVINGVGREDALRREPFAVMKCYRTNDFQEGIRAFLEKRKPVWQHR
ncbi:MAG: enoyl-CoA hydratase/isomerase family protein [Candidatus Kerfeldbacteria bacterium]|nr:enoyl-CoA hydratase/isomerase family protein [Candidatus Kerfeldbacteria bacterium]